MDQLNTPLLTGRRDVLDRCPELIGVHPVQGRGGSAVGDESVGPGYQHRTAGCSGPRPKLRKQQLVVGWRGAEELFFDVASASPRYRQQHAVGVSQQTGEVDDTDNS